MFSEKETDKQTERKTDTAGEENVQRKCLHPATAGKVRL